MSPTLYSATMDYVDERAKIEEQDIVDCHCVIEGFADSGRHKLEAKSLLDRVAAKRRGELVSYADIERLNTYLFKLGYTGTEDCDDEATKPIEDVKEDLQTVKSVEPAKRNYARFALVTRAGKIISIVR